MKYLNALGELLEYTSSISMNVAEWWLLKYQDYWTELLKLNNGFPIRLYNLGHNNNLVEFYRLYSELTELSSYHQLEAYSKCAVKEYLKITSNEKLIEWALQHKDFFLEHLNPILFHRNRCTIKENGNIYQLDPSEFENLISFGSFYDKIFFIDQIIPDHLASYLKN